MSFKEYFLQETLSNELMYLKKYLNMSDEDEAKERAYNNPYYIDDFFARIDVPEEVQNYDSDIDKTEWLEQNHPDKFIEYGKFVGKRSDYMSQSEQQLFDIASFDSFVRNKWLVHFSDDALDIWREQSFGVGTPYYDYSRLGLSTHFSGEYKKEGGFNFAYDADDVDRYYRGHHGNKYGKEAILFKGDGVKIHHYGDGEPQVIFDGKATKSPLIYLQNDGEWFITSTVNDNELIRSEDIDKVIDWVETNYAQYRNFLEAREGGKRLSDYPRYSHLSKVKIYRARKADGVEFNHAVEDEPHLPDDFITLLPKFAVEHAENNHAVEDEPQVVIRADVSPDYVLDAPNPGEYFYKGPEIKGEVVYTSLGDDYEGEIPKI